MKIYKNNLFPSDIVDIIDNHMESETNLLFVTNKKLAEFICNYVLEVHELFDDDLELSDNIKEYYVSFYFTDRECNFYCERARGNNGEFKLNDIDDEVINYFIFINMDENIAFDKLTSENGSWSWCDIVWDEDDKIDENPYEYKDDNEDWQCESGECSKDKCCRDEYKDKDNDERIEGFDYGELLDIFANRIQETKGDKKLIKKILDEFSENFIDDYVEDEDKICECDDCDCLGCNECVDCDDNECKNMITSEELEELKLIAYFTEEVLKRDGCTECTFRLLSDLYIKGKNIGWNNHKFFIKELMDEALEE